MKLTKGHGTENDFLLYADDTVRLEPHAIAAVCDRRTGIGADGVIRAASIGSIDTPAARVAEEAGAQWYMDYRNADGSPAEMCGNGVRVFTHFLRETGLQTGEKFTIGTAVGPVTVETTASPFANAAGSAHNADAATWYRVRLPAGPSPLPMTPSPLWPTSARPGPRRVSIWRTRTPSSLWPKHLSLRPLTCANHPRSSPCRRTARTSSSLSSNRVPHPRSLILDCSVPGV